MGGRTPTAGAGPEPAAAERRPGGLLSERALTPAQAERLDRLRRAARDLATRGGYAAVTIRAVAQRAGVGLATVYRYFSSKDHLIADVHALRSLEVIAELRRSPPAGGDAAERLGRVFDRMLDAIAEDPNLAAAGVAAMTSGDPAVSPPEYWERRVMASFLEAALGDEDVGDRETLGEVLGHVFFSLMIGMATGRQDVAECKAAMGRAVRLALGRDGAPG